MVNYLNTTNNCIDLKTVFNHSNVYAMSVPKLIYNNYLLIQSEHYKGGRNESN